MKPRKRLVINLNWHVDFKVMVPLSTARILMDLLKTPGFPKTKQHFFSNIVFKRVF